MDTAEQRTAWGRKRFRKALAVALAGSMVLGSAISSQAAALKDVFDAKYYTVTYKDVSEAFGTDEEALYNHFRTYGLTEGRVMNELINVQKYREAYPDLNEAFGDNWDAYVEHYISHGFAENRNSFGTFDARYYMERYPDLREVFGDDILALFRHYITYGRTEGRETFFVPTPEPAQEETVTDTNHEVSTVTGRLVDPETGSPIPNAVIHVEPQDAAPMPASYAAVAAYADEGIAAYSVSDNDVSGGDVSGGEIELPDPDDPYSAVTDENGNYIFSLPPGTYTATVTAAGYIGLTMDTLVVNDDAESVVPTITLLSQNRSGETRVKGQLTNALDGQPIADATVTIRSNWGNYTGDPVETVTTDSNGEYDIALERGYYTATYEKDGFVTKSLNVVAVTNFTSYLQNEALTPEAAAESYRIVLTWGETPRDLDSHLTGPTKDGSQFHVYFGNREYTENGEVVAALDHDDVSSWGPETVTILTPKSGETYSYYVHNFSGETSITESGARVVVYRGSQQIADYHVPVSGDGRFWNVFEIRNDQVQTVNTIRDTQNSTVE